MKRDPPIWVWTPLFSRAIGDLEHQMVSGARIVWFEPEEPQLMLRSFLQFHEEQGAQPVIIFDIARFPDDSRWAYVADGVNRSGTNPLRGLGAVMREPFIDVSRLYHVPEGQAGIEAVFLGERYPESVSEASGPETVTLAACSHLHSAAILAHTAGLLVTGVLVAEAHVPRFDLQQVRVD